MGLLSLRFVLLPAVLLPAVLLPGVLVGCGGDEALDEPDSPCGPNGQLHVGPGVEPHCDCDDGYQVQDDVCVRSTPAENPPPEPNPAERPDCGPNGSFDGRTCQCDTGYTRTGLGIQLTCEAIPPCRGTDDQHEPNDVPREATLWSEVTGPLFACPADPDWFVFSVTAGDRVTVEIRFDGTAVDLDLRLYGPSSQFPRATSFDAASSTEIAGFVVRRDGVAGIYVTPYGTGEGAYEMRVDVQPGEAPMCAGPGGFCSGPSDCCSGVCHIAHCH